MASPGDENLIASKRITVTERFDKTRVALLTYSSICIVLALATKTDAVSVPGWTGINLSGTMLGWLVLTAATAYFLVFLLSDIPASKALNRDVLRGVTWGGLRQHIAQLEADVLRNATVSAELRARVVGRQEELLGAATDAIDRLATAASYDIEADLRRTHLAELDDRLMRIERAKQGFSRGLDAAPKDWWSMRLESHTSALKAAIEKLHQVRVMTSVEDNLSTLLTSSLGREKEHLDGALARLTRYSTTLASSEVRRFRAWECAAPLLLYAIALASMIVRAVRPDWVARVIMTVG